MQLLLRSASAQACRSSRRLGSFKLRGCPAAAAVLRDRRRFAQARSIVEEHLLRPPSVHAVFNPRMGLALGLHKSDSEEAHSKHAAWISDATGTVAEEQLSKINQLCDELNQRWRAEAAIVVLEALPQDVQPTGFTAALLNYWGVGDKQLHTGLVMLFLLKQRRLEMRVGYGLAKVLSPSVLSNLQATRMVPKLREQALGEAICTGMQGVLDAMEESAPQRWRRESPNVKKHIGIDGVESTSAEMNRHGFGGGQTPIDEFQPQAPPPSGSS